MLLLYVLCIAILFEHWHSAWENNKSKWLCGTLQGTLAERAWAGHGWEGVEGQRKHEMLGRPGTWSLCDRLGTVAVRGPPPCCLSREPLRPGALEPRSGCCAGCLLPPAWGREEDAGWRETEHSPHQRPRFIFAFGCLGENLQSRVDNTDGSGHPPGYGCEREGLSYFTVQCPAGCHFTWVHLSLAENKSLLSLDEDDGMLILLKLFLSSI